MSSLIFTLQPWSVQAAVLSTGLRNCLTQKINFSHPNFPSLKCGLLVRVNAWLIIGPGEMGSLSLIILLSECTLSLLKVIFTMMAQHFCSFLFYIYIVFHCEITLYLKERCFDHRVGRNFREFAHGQMHRYSNVQSQQREVSVDGRLQMSKQTKARINSVSTPCPLITPL